MSKKVTFRPKETCYGCHDEHYDLPVQAVLSRRRFCSRECMHVNYFKFPSLQDFSNSANPQLNKSTI